MQFSLTELWQAMGPLAKGVVLVLAAMSLLSLAAAVEKWLFLSRAAHASRRFLRAWREQVLHQGYLVAASLTEQFPQCLTAQMVDVGTRVFRGVANPSQCSEIFDRVARREIAATGAMLRRGLGLIATVGSTAPFVGLFGTVIGIVNAFQTMAASGQGGLGVVSAGISEALVTTAFGIGVAIPAVWLFNALTQRIARLLTELECVAEELAVLALSESLTAATPSLGREAQKEKDHGAANWQQ